MFAVARKSSFFFITHLFTFNLSVVYFLAKGQSGRFLSVMAVFVPMWLSSSVLWSERMESYAFLRTLPVTDREIVRAKFGLAFVAAFVYWFFLTLAVRAAWGFGPALSAYLTLVNLVCACSLALAGGWYVFRWKFGITPLTVAVVTLIAVGFVAVVVLDIDRRTWPGGIGIRVARQVAEGPWFWQLGLVLLALAAYYGLMRAAVRVKAQSEVS
jgi:hypothetical protein